MARQLLPHPVASLFPDLNPTDLAALREDIRKHGVKVPILLHGGQILDGRQRYKACQELGIRCPCVEWNGHDPWLEVQSRNLLRRQLAKEQVYAIRKLAAQQFPEIAAPFDAERAQARARKAQAKGLPRGTKAALIRSQDLYRESADAIGAQVGVSGSTVKRVDRLAREAPELLPKVASGEISVRHALREITRQSGSSVAARRAVGGAADPEPFVMEQAARRLDQMIRATCEKCPVELREGFLRGLQQRVHRLLRDIGESPASSDSRRSDYDMRDHLAPPRSSAVRIGDPPSSGAHLRMADGYKR